MPLIVTPPGDNQSVWQAVCDHHGLLAHAVPRSTALVSAKLHEYVQDCSVIVGGLRCMFCQGIVEAEWWPKNVQICCPKCYSQIRSRRLPKHFTALPLEHFAAEQISPTG